jgi:alpha-1,2-mannosyltransferase
VAAVVTVPTDTAPATAPAAPPSGAARGLHGARLPRWTATALIAAAAAVLAFWIRYRLLTNAGGLGGWSKYDDGVYYAAADALVHGRLPYRDFLLLQPPGITIVLAPFAWLGSITSDPHGVVVARVAFLTLGAVNTVLVVMIARRFGTAAAVVAGVGYAVFFPAAYAERTMLLEPVGTFGMLLALLLTEGRTARSRLALVVAGAGLGLAVATKIWYVVPAVLIAVLLLDRRIVPLLGGFLGALAVTVLPFFAAAPSALLREVVVDQLGRGRVEAWPAVRRLADMLAVRTVGRPTPHQAQIILLELAGLLTVVIALTVLALTLRSARRYVALTAAAVVVLLASPAYFTHYGALLAPLLAITVGAGLARLLVLARRRWLQAVVVTLALVGVLVVNRHVFSARTSDPFPAAALRPAAASTAGCVTSDDPLVLAELNVLSRDLDRGCAVWIDVIGYSYDRDTTIIRGHAVSRPLNPRWQQDLTRYLLSGNAVIVHHSGMGLVEATHAAIERGPVLARAGQWVLRAVPHG